MFNLKIKYNFNNINIIYKTKGDSNMLSISVADLSCEYCKKTFSCQSNLTVHKKTAKYCLQIQGKTNINTNYVCEFCEKDFTSKQNLQDHSVQCKRINDKFQTILKQKEFYEKENHQLKAAKTNYEKEIYSYQKETEQLKATDSSLQLENQQLKNKLKEKEFYIDILSRERENQIKELKAMLEKANDTIAEIAMQPSTNYTNMGNTNTSNNSHNHHGNNNNFLAVNFDIDDVDRIEKTLEEHLTPSVLSKGQEGVAEMIHSKLLTASDGTPLYECTDVSRKSFEFRNRDGDVEIDPYANRLCRNLTRSGLYGIADKQGQKIWTKDDGTIDHERQTVFMPRVMEVTTMDIDSSKMCNKLATLSVRQKRLKNMKK
jgi:hypothetical protein